MTHFISYNLNSYVSIIYLQNIGDTAMETHALWKQYYAYMHQTFDSFRAANVNCEGQLGQLHGFLDPKR